MMFKLRKLSGFVKVGFVLVLMLILFCCCCYGAATSTSVMDAREAAAHQTTDAAKENAEAYAGRGG